MAAIRFSEEFTSRYGRPRPAFFPATLDDAIKESCMQPARDVSKLSLNHKMIWQLKHAINIKQNIKLTTKLNILHHFSAKFSPCIYITIQAYLQMCFARRVSAQTLLYPSLTKTSFVLDGIWLFNQIDQGMSYQYCLLFIAAISIYSKEYLRQRQSSTSNSEKNQKLILFQGCEYDNQTFWQCCCK